VHAYRIVFECVEERATIGAQSYPDAVRNEMTLEHPVHPRMIRPIGFGAKAYDRHLCRKSSSRSKAVITTRFDLPSTRGKLLIPLEAELSE
jgi:hypothetical protein